jgi:acyl-coenzyme A synthetase/AMP-(fatty) acid ligase
MLSLRERIAGAPPEPGAALEAWGQRLPLAELAAATGLEPRRAEFAGRSVLLRTTSQLGAAQGLVELDGLARRLVLCPPDLADEHLPAVLATADIDAILTDGPDREMPDLGVPIHWLRPPTEPLATGDRPQAATEWLLFTSGTTGAPKMVIHSLASLTGAIQPRPSGAAAHMVCGTYYDIRRYGGLQALLRALVRGCSLVLCEASEPLNAQLERLARLGVSHLSGTPSHWRRVLMSSEAKAISPAYVRLSGEIADQSLLESLRAAFPQATVAHAYASTEAGIGFELEDGLEGFPNDLLGRSEPVEMKVEDGSLRIRSPRAAAGYAGPAAPALTDAEGFIDTGDIVELQNGRWRFIGRRNGIINVGGLKVHPEEIEAVINRHPAVRVSRVRGRRNPIVGALVTAEVALADPQAASSPELESALRASILDLCRSLLAPYKMPATIRFVAGLALTAGGKVERSDG